MKRSTTEIFTDYMFLLVISFGFQAVLMAFIRSMLRKFFGSDDDVPYQVSFYVTLSPFVACALAGFVTLIIRHEKKSNFSPLQLFLVPIVHFGILWVLVECTINFIPKTSENILGIIFFGAIFAIASWEAAIFLISKLRRY